MQWTHSLISACVYQSIASTLIYARTCTEPEGKKGNYDLLFVWYITPLSLSYQYSRRNASLQRWLTTREFIPPLSYVVEWLIVWPKRGHIRSTGCLWINNLKNINSMKSVKHEKSTFHNKDFIPYSPLDYSTENRELLWCQLYCH